MGTDLGKLLDRVTAHYQPIVDLGTGAVVGFEALARIAETDGSARSIGPFIENIESDPALLERLLWQLLGAINRNVRPYFERYPEFYVGVNVPPSILGSGKILVMLEKLDLMPCIARLVCEVTERQALTDVGRAALEKARKLHVRIAMDDFGTGHSGLGQMLGLTFDTLKIDQSQVKHLMKDQRADRLVRGIVALANVLRARTVAEGVETAAQAIFLRAAGVDYGQGWFWSKALPPDDVPRVLEKGFGNRQRDLLALLHGTETGNNR